VVLQCTVQELLWCSDNKLVVAKQKKSRTFCLACSGCSQLCLPPFSLPPPPPPPFSLSPSPPPPSHALQNRRPPLERAPSLPSSARRGASPPSPARPPRSSAGELLDKDLELEAALARGKHLEAWAEKEREERLEAEGLRSEAALQAAQLQQELRAKVGPLSPPTEAWYTRGMVHQRQGAPRRGAFHGAPHVLFLALKCVHHEVNVNGKDTVIDLILLLLCMLASVSASVG